jgi:hypothetical protein
MDTHTRAMIAAVTFACVTGRTVAGLYDHAAGRDLRIAAEKRGDQLQGFDGERGVKFGGTLPEIYDAGTRAFVSCAIDGTKAQGYDRASSGFYTAQVTQGVVQVFDDSHSAWFAYDVQDAQSAQGYHRDQASL